MSFTSDIFILPSKWYETFSITALEVMAAELYIIASRRDGLLNILEEYKRKKYLKEPTVREIVKTLSNIITNWYLYRWDG
ncbi:MAG: glycosyltransferase [Candidatus Methanomethylicia archaeon]